MAARYEERSLTEESQGKDANYNLPATPLVKSLYLSRPWSWCEYYFLLFHRVLIRIKVDICKNSPENKYAL